VDELIPHQNEIDPKYQFLMRAPVQDAVGRRALVKFARSTKVHYVVTELSKGKLSGWRADYEGGQWVETQPTKAKRKAPTKRRKKKSTKKASVE